MQYFFTTSFKDEYSENDDVEDNDEDCFECELDPAEDIVGEDHCLGCACVTCVLEECTYCTDIFNDFDGDLKVHLIPQAKNLILIRLENIADLFDGAPAETPYFDLQTYAEELFAHSNGGQKASSVQITERTLGNNQDYAEMEKAKFHWKSTDEASTVEWPEDKDSGEVALQPQRIRLFRVQYEAADEEQAVLFLQQ